MASVYLPYQTFMEAFFDVQSVKLQTELDQWGYVVLSETCDL